MASSRLGMFDLFDPEVDSDIELDEHERDNETISRSSSRPVVHSSDDEGSGDDGDMNGPMSDDSEERTSMVNTADSAQNIDLDLEGIGWTPVDPPEFEEESGSSGFKFNVRNTGPTNIPDDVL